MALMCIPVYNLESYEHSPFRWVFVEVFKICYSFNFAKMKFVVKVIHFPIKFYKKIYFHGKFITEFCNFFFLPSHMFPWMNKFLFTEKNFLLRLIKQEGCRSSYCIFRSVYALNTCSIKLLQRSGVKVLIMLLIKQ